MSGFAEIWNLDDPNSWAAGGTNAKPRLAFTVSDPDGDSIGSVILRIYTASSGGTAAITHTLTGATLSAAIAAGYYDSSYGMLNKDQASSERWYTVEAIDALGESSGESSRTGFKVCWGQTKYDYTVPGGASSSGWAFSSTALSSGADTKVAFLFRASSGSTDSGAWASSIGSLVPNSHLHVLVRLSTRTTGTNPALPSMTFTYTTTAAAPDNWIASPAGNFTLDPSNFQYGTRSYKMAVGSTADHYFYPFRLTSGDDIAVKPNTDYVFSVHVNMTCFGGNDLRLEICSGGSLTPLATGTVVGDIYNDGPGATVDTSAEPEGWGRIHLRYKTGSGETVLRPVVRYKNTAAAIGDQGWFDGALFEEGLVVSPWHANTLSNASVLDAYGLILDALAGAKVYARASDGVTANLDDIVHAAVGGGGGGGGLNFVTVGAGTLISDIVTVA